MLIPPTIKPPHDAAPPLTIGAAASPDTSADATPTPWPSDTPRPTPGDCPLDDTLTEAAGLARNADALGPYAGSF